MGMVASVLVTQVALANALETGPTGPSLTQGSHPAVPQEGTIQQYPKRQQDYISLNTELPEILFQFKKKKIFPSAANTSLKIWPTYW